MILDAELATDGTDGLIQYVLQPGDLDTPGLYEVQGRVEVGASRWSTPPELIPVADALLP